MTEAVNAYSPARARIVVSTGRVVNAPSKRRGTPYTAGPLMTKSSHFFVQGPEKLSVGEESGAWGYRGRLGLGETSVRVKRGTERL